MFKLNDLKINIIVNKYNIQSSGVCRGVLGIHVLPKIIVDTDGTRNRSYTFGEPVSKINIII